MNDVWKRFKCGKANAGALRRNPNVGVIRQALMEGNSQLVYPRFAVPADSDDEMEA